MKTGWLIFALVLFQFLIPEALGHEVRPAYLRIQQTGDEQFELLWRVPARGEMRLGIYVGLPSHCRARTEPVSWEDAGTFIERSMVTCPGGLIGETIRIEGLAATMTDVLARVERQDGTTQVARLTPSDTSFVVTGVESNWQVAATYLSLGVEHILLGVDHLLFVLALLMLVAGWRKLVATITSFTLAHSLTLAAATLGWVNIPQSPVEAVIALSILFVAAEIVHRKQGRPGIARQNPWLIALVFGLLHGFGFAGALAEIGLPDHAIPLALLFFNLGVEAGQLFFIAAVLLSWSLLRRLNWPEWAWRIPVYGIGAMAAFWTIDRISRF